MTSGIAGSNLIHMPAAPAGIEPRGGDGFGDMFSQAVGRVEQFQSEANRQVDRFLTGETDDLHGAILATQKAELTFELFAQVRNKVVQAYQEVMRMQM